MKQNQASLSEDVKKAICVLPWIQIHVKNQGEIFPCCNISRPDLENETAEQIRSNESRLSLNKMKNSEFLRKFRTKMLAGEKPKECSSCYKMESLGIKSIREIKNRQFSSEIAALINQTSVDGYTSASLRSLDLRLGNTCNLKCRMCSPASSSALERESLDLNLSPAPIESLAADFRFENYRDLLDGNLEVEHLSMAGGEPFLIPNFFRILDYLIEQNRATKISLTIHSNITHFPERIFEKLSNFKEIKFLASVDGTEEVNSYIRYPSKWADIFRNLHVLNEQSKNPKYRSQINVTVQALNLFNLPELLKLSLSFSEFYPPILTILTAPSEMAIDALPYEILTDCKRALIHLKEEFSNGSLPAKWNPREKREFLESIDGLIQKLENCHGNAEKFAILLNRLKLVDNYRKQRTLPKFRQFESRI